MLIFQIILIFATFLCSLVAGFLFSFAVVVMPGIGKLDDAGFLRSFQVIDGVIQRNQPAFMAVWIGSVLSLIAAAVLGFWHLQGWERWGLIGLAVVYVVGVQVPTAAFNIPRNSRLAALNVGAMDETALREQREAFEGVWNRSNKFRTVVGCAVVVGLLVILVRM